MTNAEVQKFCDDYETQFGENLSDTLTAMPEPMADTAFVNRVDKYITLFVKRSNPTFDIRRLAEEEKAALYGAKLEQAFYWAKNGDMTMVVGINFDNNSTISAEELMRRNIAPMAKLELLTAGLLYRGQRSTWGDNYDI